MNWEGGGTAPYPRTPFQRRGNSEELHWRQLVSRPTFETETSLLRRSVVGI